MSTPVGPNLSRFRVRVRVPSTLVGPTLNSVPSEWDLGRELFRVCFVPMYVEQGRGWGKTEVKIYHCPVLITSVVIGVYKMKCTLKTYYQPQFPLLSFKIKNIGIECTCERGYTVKYLFCLFVFLVLTETYSIIHSLTTSEVKTHLSVDSLIPTQSPVLDKGHPGNPFGKLETTVDVLLLSSDPTVEFLRNQ